MKKLISIIVREFKLFAANKIMIILYVGGPILYGFVFNAVYSKGKISELPVVVVDRDHSAISLEFIDMIDDADVTNVKAVLHDEKALEHTFSSNIAYAVVVIPYRFQSDVLQRRRPEIIEYIDNTNLLSAGYVSRSLSATAATFNSMLVTRSGRGTDAFRVNTFKLFNPSSNYAIFIWPSFLAIVLQSVVMVVLALSFSSEHEKYSFAELCTGTRQSPVLILSGKIIPYLLLASFSLLVYGVYFHLFRQKLPDASWALLLITSLFILTNCFIGTIAGMLFKKQLACLQFLMVLSMPVYISSGFSWPFDETGILSKVYASLFPFMPFINAFRILLIEHGHLNDIVRHLQLQLIQLLFYMMLSFIIVRYRIKRPFKNMASE